MSGPGQWVPTGRPSTAATGITPPAVEVMNTGDLPLNRRAKNPLVEQARSLCRIRADLQQVRAGQSNDPFR